MLCALPTPSKASHFHPGASLFLGSFLPLTKICTHVFISWMEAAIAKDFGFQACSSSFGAFHRLGSGTGVFQALYLLWFCLQSALHLVGHHEEECGDANSLWGKWALLIRALSHQCPLHREDWKPPTCMSKEAPCSLLLPLLSAGTGLPELKLPSVFKL